MSMTSAPSSKGAPSRSDAQANLTDFISPASFWFPDAVVESAWHEHAPFAFWLADVIRPRIFVELGSHRGFSYLAFCQAAERLGVETKGYAIDTWQGDEHAGFYGNEVYERLRDYHEPRYGHFSRLIRSTFDDALEHFSDGSIDLLHIDGRHFYDDVKHDFESWKSKLSNRAVVLFHDTNVRERGFGVFKLWDELSEQYPSFEFLHGHGLGILGIGSDRSAKLDRLFTAASDQALTGEIHNTYYRLGMAIGDYHKGLAKAARIDALSLTVDEGTAEIASLNQNILNLRLSNEEAQHQLAAHNNHIEDLERTLEERAAKISSFEAAETEKAEKIAQLEARLMLEQEREAHSKREFAALREKFASLEVAIHESGTQIAQNGGEYQRIYQAKEDAERQLLEAKIQLGDLQRKSASSRWLLRKLSGKMIHAPRDISRRIRRSRRKRKENFTLPLTKNTQIATSIKRISNPGYRKYLASRFVLRFKPILSESFARRMGNRMAKNAPSALIAMPTAKPDVLFDQLFTAAKSSSTEFVALDERPFEKTTAVRPIAFYLPQFHPIAENDEWWGKGFTEWTNVTKAVPQFVGHYQPRLPDELGFYDLRIVDVMRRQVELAKNYGIYGFCFHYYWFTGRKRLLERPLDQFVADSTLDFPFCICWANENWTRRWDGNEQEILMEQRHEPQDDLEFIEDLAPYLKNPRYIRVNGRPLIIVYRVNIFSDPKKTAKVWREYCMANGIGDPWLVAAQSFRISDPRPYGFDAAVEFPPHNLWDFEPAIDLQFLNLTFRGKVIPYEDVVEKCSIFSWPDYPLYKALVPSWDNEARRPGRGTVLQGATPELYKRWLTNYVHKTDEHYKNDTEKLVFINAWNEWAEGAYLEPDRRFGYGYLQATRDVLSNGIEGLKKHEGKRQIALVSHDAYPHGAQYLSLHLAKAFRDYLGYDVDLISLGEGPLREAFAEVATFHELTDKDPQGVDAHKLARDLRSRGIKSAIVNTTVSGLFVETLKQEGFRVISLIHELPGIIHEYGLERHAEIIVEQSDVVVFAADLVRTGFHQFAALDVSRTAILPQGLYKDPASRDAAVISRIRSSLRGRLNLSADAQIILGVGYADHRKGIDLFVESAIDVCRRSERAVFVWVGDFEKRLQPDIEQRVAQAGLGKRIIFPGRVPIANVGDYYLGADLYLLTSREDPFPSVVLEAMDSGLPVVAFDGTTGCTEVVRRTGSRAVRPFDVAAIATNIVDLLENGETREKAAVLGREIVASEFSFRLYAFELAALADPDLKRVSVIVPNFNHRQYLEERLRSIQAQTYPISEVIVLDDASSDGSREWLEENLSRLIPGARFIANERNSGNVSHQWVKGVAAASGDFIWIAESDDIAEPEFLETTLKAFNDPDVVLSYCQSRQIDENGLILADHYLDYVSDLSREKWMRPYTALGTDEISGALAVKNTIPNVSAAVFRRALLLKRLDQLAEILPDYSVAGDWLMYVELLSDGKITFDPHPLNRHRRHSKSVTHEVNAVRHLCEIIQVQRWVRTRFRLPVHVQKHQDLYAKRIYEQFGLNTINYPTIETHSELQHYF